MTAVNVSWLSVSALLACIITAAPAEALPSSQTESLTQQAHDCSNVGGQISPDVQIAGCTALIQYPGPNPDRAGAYNNRAAAFETEGDYASAIADLTQAIRLNPRVAAAYWNRGLAYNRMHNFTAAIPDVDRATQLNPNNFLYQNARCWTRAFANVELDVALAACDESLRLSPNNPNVISTLGLVSLKQHRWQVAWNYYNTAVNLTGEFPAHYLFGRGISALRLGQTTEGQADLDRATQLDPKIVQTYADFGITSAQPSN